MSRNFTGGPVVKSLPANTGDMGSIPGLGRFHMTQGNQARVPQLPSPHSRVCALQRERPLQRKPTHRSSRVAPAHHNERKPTHGNEDPGQPKLKTGKIRPSPNLLVPVNVTLFGNSIFADEINLRISR